MNLDYFIATLPTLLEGQPARLSEEDFRESCAEQLSPALFRAVAAMLDGTSDSHPFVQAWRDRDAQLRNAVAAERARRRGLAPSEAPSRETAGFDAAIAPAVAAAFAQSDPLARERALDHVRWTLLDELEGVQPMDENVILAYAAKLKISLRTLAADADKGLRRFGELTAK